MKNTLGRSHARQTKNRWTSLFAIGASLAVVAGVALTSAGAASAAVQTPNTGSTLPCTITVTGGGTLVPSTNLITGVVAGTTQIKFDCNASSGASVAAEASLLAAIGATNVVPTAEADTTSLGTFTPSSTDTGCPAGTGCTIATFAVPATFTAAGDANAQCPPTAAQINDGLFGCAVAVATSTETEIAGGEYLLQYASQSTAPAAPTISSLQTSGSPGSLINVSDAASATGFWWGDAVQEVQAVDAGSAPAVAPSSCATGGGYGNVPSSNLVEAWYVAGSSTPAFTGPATNVTISNDCYTGTTLVGPVLGGTIAVPSTVTSGTSYTVYLCEVNATPYASNDSKSASVCGTAAPSYIDASFPFSVTAKTLSQNLPESATLATASTAGYTTQLTSSGNTGTVTYTQTAGTPQVVVSGSGAVTTSGALAAGTYTATGTTADPNGDAGTFTFKLTVTGAVATAPAPKATRVVGYGIIGRTDTITIIGTGFTAGSRIIGHAGTVATPLHTTSTRITTRLRVVKSAKKGTFRLTIQFKSGKKASVVYKVR
jgi:hypothetical protein